MRVQRDPVRQYGTKSVFSGKAGRKRKFRCRDEALKREGGGILI